MVMWLYELLIGRKSCRHKWVIHAERPLIRNYLRKQGVYRYGTQYDLQCELCGNFKIVNS